MIKLLFFKPFPKVLYAVLLISVGVWLESKDQFLDTSRKARNWKDSQRETIAKLFSFYYQSQVNKNEFHSMSVLIKTYQPSVGFCQRMGRSQGLFQTQ